jgi:ATP-dependent exoDNAse (exonuclease V) beta subunit
MIFDSTPSRFSTAPLLAAKCGLGYVTLTRARDYLVLCLTPKTNTWLDLALAHSTVQLPITSPDGVHTLSLGAKTTIPVQVFRPTPITRPIVSPAAISWVPARTGRKEYPPARLSPSKLPPSADGTTATGTQVITGVAVALSGKPSYDLFGTAIHDFLAVDCLQRGSGAERHELLEGLLARYGVAGAVNTKDLIGNIDGFYAFLEKLNPLRVLTEWPVHLTESDLLLSGTADLLVETAQGWVIIDHKTFPGPRTKWAHEAENYLGQLSAYEKMVAAATGKKVTSAYLHFVCGGGIIQLM